MGRWARVVSRSQNAPRRAVSEMRDDRARSGHLQALTRAGRARRATIRRVTQPAPRIVLFDRFALAGPVRATSLLFVISVTTSLLPAARAVCDTDHSRELVVCLAPHSRAAQTATP